MPEDMSYGSGVKLGEGGKGASGCARGGKIEKRDCGTNARPFETECRASMTGTFCDDSRWCEHRN